MRCRCRNTQTYKRAWFLWKQNRPLLFKEISLSRKMWMWRTSRTLLFYVRHEDLDNVYGVVYICCDYHWELYMLTWDCFPGARGGFFQFSYKGHLHWRQLCIWCAVTWAPEPRVCFSQVTAPARGHDVPPAQPGTDPKSRLCPSPSLASWPALLGTTHGLQPL